MPPPVLLLSSNARSKSRHVDTIERIRRELNPVPTQPRFTIIQRIETSPEDIVRFVQMYRDDLGLFHFGGRDDDFQALLNAAQVAGISSFPEYLYKLPQLKLVFLCYCSRPRFVEELQDAGIHTIVGTSRRLTHQQTTDFASVFYQQFLVDRETTQDAFDAAVLQSGISRTNGAYYAGLHGNNKLRRWWNIEPPPRIVGELPPLKPRIIGDEASPNAQKSTSAQPAEQPNAKQPNGEQTPAGQQPPSDPGTSNPKETNNKQCITQPPNAQTSNAKITVDFLDQQLEKLRKKEPRFVESGQAIAMLADHTSMSAPNGKTFDEIEEEWGYRSVEYVARLVDLDLLQKEERGGEAVYRGWADLDTEIARRFIANKKPQRADGINVSLPRGLGRMGRAGFRRYQATVASLARGREAAGQWGQRNQAFLRGILLGILISILLFVITPLIRRSFAALNPEQVAVQTPPDPPAEIPAARSSVDSAVSISFLQRAQVLRAATDYPRTQRLLFSDNGSYVMAAGDDATLDIWHFTESRPLLSIATHANPIDDVAVDVTGDWATYTDRGGTVRLYSFQSGEHRFIANHEAGVTPVRFTNDGSAIISGGRNGQLAHYTLATGETRTLLPQPGNRIIALAVAPGNRRIAYATAEDNMIYVWDWVAAERINAVQNGGTPVETLQFHPAESELLITTQNEVMVWNIAQTAQPVVLEQTARISPVARYLPDGSYLITTNDVGQLRLSAGGPRG
ncbi:MAG: hypothetical protein KDE19_00890, partial [Caldilineaceae bacterium]|nr:hypothetical protein [Caldilineaceae bacterium]